MANFFTENRSMTAYRAIEKATFDEFYEEIKKDVHNNDMPDINPVDLALKVQKPNKMLFKPLYTEDLRKLAARYHNREARSSATNAERLYDDVVLDINKVEADLTIEESLPIIKSIREGLGKDFFGAILHENGKNTQQSINVLNPVIAVAIKNLIDNGTDSILKKKYSIIVYALKKNVRRTSLEEMTTKRNLAKDVEHLMIAPNISRGISEQYGSFRRDSEVVASVEIVLKDRNGNRATNDAQYSIVPVQIANFGGLMYPSYGAVLFNGNSGMNLTPFQSANVGEPGGSGSTWSNVCTGSLNSSTDTGKMSLNHSNNTSPLNRRNIGVGAIQWAHACTDMALQLLIGEPVVEEPVMTKRMSLKEFQEKNPGTTTKDFVAYIRELNEKELPEW